MKIRFFLLSRFLLVALLIGGVSLTRAFALDESDDSAPSVPSFEGGFEGGFDEKASREIRYDSTPAEVLSIFERQFECQVLAGRTTPEKRTSGECECRGPCQEVVVRCLSPEKLREELERQRLATCSAMCSIVSCEIFVSEAWCLRFGFRDRQTIPIPALRRQIDDHPPASAAEAIMSCALQHERKHLEQDARSTPICILEQEAYWEQTLCLEQYKNQFCGSGNGCTPNCLLLTAGVCEAETLRALNGCSCQISSEWCSRCQGLHCDTCQKICGENFSACQKPPFEACGATLLGVNIPEVCKGYTDSYCRRHSH